MKGLKYLLIGFMFIFISGFILMDIQSYLGGYGEMLLFLIGIIPGIKGLTTKE